jgi:signal transduction histidine kinase/ligand-binding sensor domain-containing protein/DNA-binding NarL/FixJ family response regulator
MRIRLTICLVVLAALAATSVPVNFYSVNNLFGISMRVTNSICKDENGFVWASSKTGILRLTDDDYRIYQLPFETTGAIIVKLAYRNGGLFAYTNNGQVFRYDPLLDKFGLVLNLAHFLGSQLFDVYHLLIDPEGDLWFALDIGLYKYHNGEFSLVGEISRERYGITWYDDHQILVARVGGILLFDVKGQKRKEVHRFNGPGPLSVYSLLYDQVHRHLWMGTLSNGLFCYDFNDATLHHPLQGVFPHQPVLALAENSDSTILAGIDGQGIWELEKSSRRLLSVFKDDDENPFSLRGNGVYDIFCEPGKRVWIATISGGVSFYNLASPVVDQYVHHANDPGSLVNNDVNAILEDRDGKIWMATNNGISCRDVRNNRWSSYYHNKLEQAQVFLALAEDGHGHIWAGSYSSGFYLLDQKTGQEVAHYCRGDQMPAMSNFIFDFLQDSEGDMWIGGVNGDFLCYSVRDNQFRTFSEEPVSSFAELAPGEILLGFSYGLSLLNKKSGELKNLLTGVVVQDILVDGEVIWLCTSGEGLLEYNSKSGSIQKYDAKSGLPSNFVNSILSDGRYLWLGTENGLCRFNPADKSTNSFQSIFPISSVSFNKSAAALLRNGRMAWGTNYGMVVFDPESLREIPASGRIFFQDLTISGRSVREIQAFGLDRPVDSLQSIRLKYFQNTISLEVLPLGVPPGATFSWLLEGFDKDWNRPSNNRTITYTNLPSDHYTLHIKMMDNSMTHILSDRSLDLRLIPPVWRRSWFWVLVLAIILGIVLLYLLLYINGLKQKHTEEKVRFFTNTAHDFRTSLTLIKAPVEELGRETQLTDKGRYYLQIAQNQIRQLTSVVTQLMDFQKADIGKENLGLSGTDVVRLVAGRILMFKSLAESKNIALGFHADCDHCLTAVDEPKMEKVIDNLVSNAIKYSNSGTCVQIDLKCGKKQWTLLVRDQGIGMGKKAQRQLFREFYRGENAVNARVPGSGLGLLLVKKYVTLHGGDISCESRENGGSTFRINIPLREVPERTPTMADPSELQPTRHEQTVHEPAVPGHDTQLLSGDVLPSNTGPSGFDAAAQSFPVREGAAAREMKVFLVEDHEDLLNFMETALEGEFMISVARDGEEAWENIRRQLPDLVVSDVVMPRMNGFDLCRQMKSTWETSHIPVILLTALTDKKDQLQGLGLGADDYLTKPFDMNLLIQRIKTLIQNRELIREKTLKLMVQNDPAPLMDNEHNDKFVRKILEVAKTHLSDDSFDKEEFAMAMNVSSSLLYKKMKALTGMSPTDFMKTIRLQHASELLQSRKYSVTEVSEMCGFSSVGYFSTVFKKHFKKSPSDLLDH